MRLTAPLFGDVTAVESWVAALQRKGFTAASELPVGDTCDEAVIDEFANAARENDIVIAEVGAWCNPLSPDADERREALRYCKHRLALADRVGARCCVNIAGSRGRKWDGPHPANLTDESFTMIVATVREIIDDVRPERTYYTLETMPWMYPHTTKAYKRLLAAVERDAFAVHFDPVNMLWSPHRFFHNAELVDEFVSELAPFIRACHAKDAVLADSPLVHIDECCPGDGGLDYGAYLRALDRLDPDTPLVLEHMKREEDFDRGLAHIRLVARQQGIALR